MERFGGRNGLFTDKELLDLAKSENLELTSFWPPLDEVYVGFDGTKEAAKNSIIKYLKICFKHLPDDFENGNFDARSVASIGLMLHKVVPNAYQVSRSDFHNDDDDY